MTVRHKGRFTDSSLRVCGGCPFYLIDQDGLRVMTD